MRYTELGFSYNWNNKLNCDCFTTIRLHQPDRFKLFGNYSVTLKKQYLKDVNIRDIKILYLNQLNEFIAHIDTGYSLQETTDLIRKMYPKVDFEKQKLCFMLLKTIK